MLTNKRERVRKGGQRFGIPGRLANRKGLLIQQLMSKNGHERKQAQQGGSRAQNRQVRPLALRLHAQDACAPHERSLPPANARQTRPRSERGQRFDRCTASLRLKLAFGVTNEHPTDGKGGTPE